MITEKGTIKTSAEVTEEAQKELNKSGFRCAVFIVVVGVAVSILAIAKIFVDIFTEAPFSLTYALWLFFGLLLAIFGVFLIKGQKAAGENLKQNPTVDETEFFNDHFFCREFVNGELLVISKIYYNRIKRIKQTPNYVFIFNTTATAIVVDKRTLTSEELSTVIRLVTPQPANAGAPAEPFAEMKTELPEEKAEEPVKTQEEPTQTQDKEN